MRMGRQCKEGIMLSLKFPSYRFASSANAADIAATVCLLLHDKKAGIYNIAGSDYKKRVALAVRVLKYFPEGKYNLEPISTASLAQPAARPLLGSSIMQKFSKEYPEYLFGNVDDYLCGKWRGARVFGLLYSRPLRTGATSIVSLKSIGKFFILLPYTAIVSKIKK